MQLSLTSGRWQAGRQAQHYAGFRKQHQPQSLLLKVLMSIFHMQNYFVEIMLWGKKRLSSYRFWRSLPPHPLHKFLLTSLNWSFLRLEEKLTSLCLPDLQGFNDAPIASYAVCVSSVSYAAHEFCRDINKSLTRKQASGWINLRCKYDIFTPHWYLPGTKEPMQIVATLIAPLLKLLTSAGSPDVTPVVWFRWYH